MSNIWQVGPGNGGKVLLSFEEANLADTRRRALGLPPHFLPAKVWESMVAFDLIVSNGDPRTSRVADLGARHGIILCSLAKRGFRNLWGCDLKYPFPPLKTWLRSGYFAAVFQASIWIALKRLRLSRQDLCRTRYPGNSFDFITCLSVIEHVSEPDLALAEMRRLLRPGGLALVSTDYWETPVDTSSISVCGQPGRVYDRVTIDRDLIQRANAQGLELCGPVDFETREPVVSFLGLQYTFIFLLFRAV